MASARLPERRKVRDSTLVRFAAVSLLGTVIDFSVLWLLVAHANVGVVPATVVSTEATIVNAFTWNSVWIFRKSGGGPGSLVRRFVSFNAMYAATLVLSAVVVGGLVAAFGSQYYLIYKALTLPINFAWNYLWSSRVIWRAGRGTLG